MKAKQEMKHFAIKGDRIGSGEIGMRMITRFGKPAVVVYWPAGIQNFPDVLQGDNALDRWERIKASYELVEMT